MSNFYDPTDTHSNAALYACVTPAREWAPPPTTEQPEPGIIDKV